MTFLVHLQVEEAIENNTASTDITTRVQEAVAAELQSTVSRIKTVESVAEQLKEDITLYVHSNTSLATELATLLPSISGRIDALEAQQKARSAIVHDVEELQNAVMLLTDAVGDKADVSHVCALESTVKSLSNAQEQATTGIVGTSSAEKDDEGSSQLETRTQDAQIAEQLSERLENLEAMIADITEGNLAKFVSPGHLAEVSNKIENLQQAHAEVGETAAALKVLAADVKVLSEEMSSIQVRC